MNKNQSNQNNNNRHIYARVCQYIVVLSLFIFGSKQIFAQKDSIHFPIHDRYGDPYNFPEKNTFNFKDTSFVHKTIEYDPKTKQYYIIERIGNHNYRTPAIFTMKEFLDLQSKKDEQDYFKKRAALLNSMNRRTFKPKFKITDDWFNRIMGNGKVDIKPTGYVELLAGSQTQKTQNPTLPERSRKTGGFDFDMKSQVQIDGNIGDKLKLPINYNTLANFDFQNQIKLDYHGKDDEILKQFQAGNVNFTTKSALITGAQGLFGIKTQLQFGKLFITGVLANQRTQRQSLNTQGNSTLQDFNISADEYEENRHFLIAQYFKENYNKAMAQLPIINSSARVLRMEVWVTNHTGITTNTRDVVGLMDLAEINPFGPWRNLAVTDPRPSNISNKLLSTILQNPNCRNSSQIQSILTSLNLQPVQDFEKTFARKLQPSDYYFNPKLGYISLNMQLQPDEVLGVAYEYTYNGKRYQVGEFSQDLGPDTTAQKILFLKLLKATSQRTNLPIWKLMMKNVYAVGYGQIERNDFKLDIVYDEPSLGQKRYLPITDISPAYQGKPLLQMVNLDHLNNNNDPQPDGVFDFIDSATVISSISRIIFPVLEPFGHDMDYAYSSQTLRNKYLFYPLYDTIKAIAQTYANLDRFKLVGKSKSTITGDYQLGINIPRGSVTVSAGGRILQENIDYEINYDLGTMHVINPAIISTGVPVNVQFENQSLFAATQRGFSGVRMDYLVNKKLALGATYEKLGERPFFIKQQYGEDPIRNKMYGADLDYRNKLPRLTKWLDKLPFYSTKTMSTITANAEVASFKPGHAPQIGRGSSGQVYLDDFEGTKSTISLQFPVINWNLASTPQGNGMFPEGSLSNDLSYGFNRAKIAWYNIEPTFQQKGATNNPYGNNLNEISKSDVRPVYQNEIFPKKSLDYFQGPLTTFDVAYYPKDKGPYNYESKSSRIDNNGKFKNPRQAWGGLMRNIDQTDFESANIESLDFWVKDPYVNNTLNPNGGQLYFNLGDISEDILKDGKRFYENGLPTPNINAPVDSTTSVWGSVPLNSQQVTNAFSTNPSDRKYQDVGFDGINDDQERRKFKPYLNAIQTTAPNLYQKAINDPSADNFIPYRDASFDNTNATILSRYKNINNPQGNSPIANNSQFVNAFTQYPDAEEMNRDNTMNEVEEYFQYKIDIQNNMQVGSTKYLIDKRSVNVTLPNNTQRVETWYHFNVPIKQYDLKVGNIPDFKSIRFIRMFLSGFDDSVVFRFATLNLIRNNWRKFSYVVDSTAQYKPLPNPDPTTITVTAVNIEEDDTRQPIRYVIPPGIARQQQLSNNNVPLYLNEQALSLKICNLPITESRGVFKSFNVNLNQYGRMEMFIHAEATGNQFNFNDNELLAVIRIGNDYAGNYYEIKIPLKKTAWGETDSLKIWPSINNLDFNLQDLVSLKRRRNKLGISPNTYYKETYMGNRTISIVGNPNLGEVKGIFLGIENPFEETVCAEVWYNELRLSNLNEQGGWAAQSKIDLRLADLGVITIAGTARTAGFGTIDQKINERAKETSYTIDAAASLEAGKLLPKKWDIQIPIYASYSTLAKVPLYDPFMQDVKLKDALNDVSNTQKKDSIKNYAQDVTTIKTISFNNVQKRKLNQRPSKIWSVSNFIFNYSYFESLQHSPLMEKDYLRRSNGGVAYAYSPKIKPYEPFKKLIKSKSRWLALIKEINVNYAPTQISIVADLLRQYGTTLLRNVGGGTYKLPANYFKSFIFDRTYILQWNLTKSINLSYNAVNHARIDEPYGPISKITKDTVFKNLLKGGRNTSFNQNLGINYQVPTTKIPILNWTTLNITYNTAYNWLAASLLRPSIGNTLSNTQIKNVNAALNFEQLYNKSKLLRSANNNVGPENMNRHGNTESHNTTSSKKPVDTIYKKVMLKNIFGKDSVTRLVKKIKIHKDANALPNIAKVPKFMLQLLTAVKQISIQYTEDLGTILPGYMDSTQFFGHNFRSGNPSSAFILGYQPDTNWINKLGKKGLLTHDELLSDMIQQRFAQHIDIRAQIRPVREFNIDVSFLKDFNKSYSELYKDTTGTSGLSRLSPYSTGTYRISYLSYQSLFTSFKPDELSQTFKQFQEYRKILSKRLAYSNIYQTPLLTPDGFYKGYSGTSQEVILPAFLAAFTHKDPNQIQFIKNNNPNIRSNPFSGIIPKPNWNINYTGLSSLPGLKKIFQTFTIKHGYHSNLGINSFNSALLFDDPFHAGYPKFFDSTSNNYVPYFLVPNLSIEEAFDPLIGVDMTFTNQISVSFEYKKSRSLSLSLYDYQLAENRSTEYSFRFDWRRKGVPIIKKLPFMKGKLTNDVTFHIDYSVRDDAAANSRLDFPAAQPTGGQKIIHIAPSIDYVVNSRINVKLYYSQDRSIPKISTSFPITNTKAGASIRISLTQ